MGASSGNAQLAAQNAAARRHPLGIREAVAPDADAVRRMAARSDVARLALRADDDGGSATCHAPVERRVEPSLERHLSQPRLEHPQRLEDVRDPPGSSPGGDAGRDRVAETEDVHDVRPLEPPEREWERGRNAHPAVAERRSEVRDLDAVARFRPRAPCRSGMEVDERRRQHRDVVLVCRKALGELPRHGNRPAERDRGPPRRGGEENPQCGAFHGGGR